MKHFYSHLIELKVLQAELDETDLKKEEKEELLHHVHGSIHYAVLDVILSELKEEHKKTLIDHINNEDHDEVWKHLKEHIEGIEAKIKNISEKVVYEFANEVKTIKKTHR